MVTGHHNLNYIVALGTPLAWLLGEESGQVRAKFRFPYETVEVVPRIWRSESEVLRAVSNRLSDVPRCIHDFGTWSVHAFLEGCSLAEEAPVGEPVGTERLAAFAEFFARVADIPESELPRRPDNWPEDGDSAGFLRWLADFADGVHHRNLARFGELFDAVGVPSDAVGRFMDSVPDLAERPFALLHTDVHRANVVVTRQADNEYLSVIDWELAMYGDPLHDLATHLIRMDYDVDEYAEMIHLWKEAMCRSGHAEMTEDMERDLPVYIDFEYVQSVFPDVMRAALGLPAEPGHEDFARAARSVCRAMTRAWKLLMMEDAPVDEHTAEEALRAWHAADRAGRMELQHGG
ncbi:aminoglycoside phosphotransferase family protein [Streptomyces sp. YC419]|uniref:Aminoglycoside phosphotransferase family protein n=2 Tax=Streptomyces ureilyticus TaxID=1775131 RepID=A0ABX0DN78_9ACTN|nr:aminoglycoside phosphotransferase family protein [Streptomyces ureilyticus]